MRQIAQDAIRLLSNASFMISYFEFTEEGWMPPCKTTGELLLQNALHYLAYGDTENATYMIELYDEWRSTGYAPWPYDPNEPPPSAQL